MNLYRKYAVRFLIILLLGLPLLFGVWAFLIEPDRLIVVEEQLALPGWPQSHGRLKIALFSDLHAGAPFMNLEKIETLVTAVNALEPDLVIMAGDFVIDGVIGGKQMTAEDFAPHLARLKAPLGLFAVLGNHDNWNDAGAIARAFERVGIGVLENAAARIRRESGDFWLVGLADFMAGNPDPGRAFEGLDAAPAIAVTHNPDIYASDRLPVALALAGHTHGGQVTLPLIGPPIVPSLYGDRYARGFVVEKGMPIFVTSGLGTSILPVRFGVPPEVVLLTVTSK